jgi:cobalt-zinc-cadmium resistance protein CzcA
VPLYAYPSYAGGTGDTKGKVKYTYLVPTLRILKIMINNIISFSVKNKFIIGLFVLAMIGWGTYSLTRLPIDAIPDITNNQVQIISLAPSLAVQEVESFITAPIEVAVANIPDIIELRSISRLGLSVVTVVFEDKVDIYWARQQLSERLKEAEESIPDGLAQISLAPISSGLGEIFQYRLVVEKGYEKEFNPMELRTIPSCLTELFHLDNLF